MKLYEINALIRAKSNFILELIFGVLNQVVVKIKTHSTIYRVYLAIKFLKRQCSSMRENYAQGIIRSEKVTFRLEQTFGARL